jgi:hypothetical protein
VSGTGMNYYRRGRAHAPRMSGGDFLQAPKTPAERLALYVKLAKLKTDFLRRQRQREAANNDGH